MAILIRPLPDLHERVWGGTRLDPAGTRQIGEAWLAGPANRIAAGPDAGRSLDEIARRDGAAFVGTRAFDRLGPRFPLLVKLLDPVAWLSVQVHPDDALARRLAGPEAVGKTEAWYVLDADPGAELLLGARSGVSGRAVRSAMRARQAGVAPLLARRRARPGDACLVEAGTLHSVGPGMLLYELQQPSDLTYRCEDWGRPETPTRRLHVEEALEATRPAARPRLSHPAEGVHAVLAACEHFVLDRYLVEAGRPVTLEPAGVSLRVITALGPVRVTAAAPAADDAAEGIGRHETVVLPAAAPPISIVADEPAEILVASVP